MSKFNGEKISIEIFGSSHSEYIGANVYGFPKFLVQKDKLAQFMSRRKASNNCFSTKRIEDDDVDLSFADDNSFSIKIQNNNTKSQDYSNLYGKPRPSHADYSSYLKEGTLDYTGGGRFSGRMTAPLCAVGGIAKQILESKGIKVEGYISRIGNIQGKNYQSSAITTDSIIKDRVGFPSLSLKQEMLDEITKVASLGDSVGGQIDCIVSGLKGGIGDNLFGGLEGKLSLLIYAIPAVKGVEFGSGTNISTMLGSEANDPLEYENGSVVIKTNNAGGINGGITNGNDITMRVSFRPTPSISLKQNTIDLVNKQNTQIEIKGRHDACLVVRAVPCVESAVSIALLDILLSENKL